MGRVRVHTTRRASGNVAGFENAKHNAHAADIGLKRVSSGSTNEASGQCGLWRERERRGKRVIEREGLCSSCGAGEALTVACH